MNNYHTTIVSSIGTSILTNNAGDVSALLRRAANMKNLSDFGEDQARYESHLAERKARILEGTKEDVCNLSAELNGIFALSSPAEQICLLEETYHFLLCTDTVQGKATAEIVKERLRQENVRSVEICVLKGMTTASQHDFAQGVDSLLDLCEKRLKPLRGSGHRILFNLVGGFKSLQAYLQMLGMIYADEICYLFESPGSPLLRIPRLPIHFDLEPLRQSAALMARLATGAIVREEDVSVLPSIYVEIDGGYAVLSTWGKFVWNSEKQNLLSGTLLEHPGIRYEHAFKKDYERCKEAPQRVAFQEAIAKAAVLWAENGLKELRRDGGLQYETYQNRKEIGHFRVDKGRRISCLPDGDTLVLRHMGSHDYVNDNP